MKDDCDWNVVIKQGKKKKDSFIELSFSRGRIPGKQNLGFCAQLNNSLRGVLSNLGCATDPMSENVNFLLLFYVCCFWFVLTDWLPTSSFTLPLYFAVVYKPFIKREELQWFLCLFGDGPRGGDDTLLASSSRSSVYFSSCYKFYCALNYNSWCKQLHK